MIDYIFSPSGLFTFASTQAVFWLGFWRGHKAASKHKGPKYVMDLEHEERTAHNG